MPVATTMKDGTYVLIFEGTYRDRDLKFMYQKIMAQNRVHLLSYVMSKIN
jgi:hypothetical protein